VLISKYLKSKNKETNQASEGKAVPFKYGLKPHRKGIEF